MKLPFAFPALSRRAATMPAGGFTLPEILISVTLFIILIGGILSAHLFGLSMFRITENKLNATDEARKMIGKMANEIRTCSTTYVGDVRNRVFEGKLDGETQEGTSLQIYPTTDTNIFINYFVDPSDQTFKRTTSAGNEIILAESITNAVVFSARDHLSNVLTNNRNNRVIHLVLEFYQPKRHQQVADYYKLETSVTRRALLQ